MIKKERIIFYRTSQRQPTITYIFQWKAAIKVTLSNVWVKSQTV